MRRTAVIAIILSLILIAPSLAQNTGIPGYTPTPENLSSREWFRDARFGLFIHWGVYSVLEKGEWVMNQDKMTITEYEKLPPQFNPTAFDPDAWCQMAVDAGMKYITITSKHHDGFAMWDSKVSGYDVVDSTPYGRDILKQLADACQRHGLKLFFYHSQLDWHHPDYFPRGRTGQTAGRPDSGDWNKYLDYMDAQLAELLTGYGPVAGIWFDGMWDKPDADWRLGTTYKLIHDLQPAALVGSNHHRAPFAGEDYQMFEKGLPGRDPYGDGSVSALPLETCETINNSWGYNASDSSQKSVAELIHYLVQAAGNDANFLLNVGPRPDGTIQNAFRERLAEMGAWLRENGEAIYGTRGGPVPPRSWGVTTRNGDTVYVHVMSDTDTEIVLPLLERPVRSARLLHGGPVTFETTSLGTIIRLPETGRDDYDTIIALEMGR